MIVKSPKKQRKLRGNTASWLLMAALVIYTMFVITSLENDKEEEVLVRIQSSTCSKEDTTNIQGLVNLQGENKIMAPTYYERFESGRVEVFYSFGYTPCHMDAQSLNLLVSKENNDVKLIDYEYASWNPRAADLANTFCEYCNQNNLQALYETQYPSPSQQEEFMQTYLQAMGNADKFQPSDYFAL